MRPAGISRWVLGLLIVGSSAFLASSARADHCSGDKDHLNDYESPATGGSCGYFVEPVSSPSPSSTPEPLPTQPVTVENRPNVRIVQPVEDDPVRVTVENQPEAPSDGWSADDSQHLMELHQFVVHLGGLIAFALGLVVTFVLPKVL